MKIDKYIKQQIDSYIKGLQEDGVEIKLSEDRKNIVFSPTDGYAFESEEDCANAVIGIWIGYHMKCDEIEIQEIAKLPAKLTGSKIVN